MKAREPIWWMPLLRRTLVWGAAMAALWFLPLLLIGVLVALLLPSVVWPASLAWLCLGTGFVTGGVCACFAPPTDPANPLNSRLFKTAGLDTAFYFVGLGGLLNLVFAQPTFAVVVSRFVSAIAFEVALTLALFGFCLSLALTRALRATKLK